MAVVAVQAMAAAIRDDNGSDQAVGASQKVTLF